MSEKKPNLPEEFMEDGTKAHEERGALYDRLSEEQIALMETLTPKQKEMLKGRLIATTTKQHQVFKILANKLLRKDGKRGCVFTEDRPLSEITIDEIREYADISAKLIDGITKTSKILLQLKEENVDDSAREAEEEVDFQKYLESAVVKSKRKIVKKPSEVDKLLELTAKVAKH